MKFEYIICFVALSILFSSTEPSLAADAISDNHRFIVSLNSYLSRSLIAEFIIPFRDYLSLCGGATSGDIVWTTTQSYTWAWQDFFLLHIITRDNVQELKKPLEHCVVGISFHVTGVGGVSVMHIAPDTSLRSVSAVFAEGIGSASQPHRSRWRPRNYFGLQSNFKWTGKGVRIAFLDTGLYPDLLSANSLKSCTSFVPGTPCGNDVDDHGVFSVSVATSMRFSNINDTVNNEKYTNYLGVAPLAQVHMMRVFDDFHETRTSWCVAAINAALQWGSDVISLSFGGNDYYDTVFTDKISTAAAAGVIIVAATGNDGPHFGSVHNPADLAEVLAVGSLGALPVGLNRSKRSRWVSFFSGRGPTTWELPFGVGRVRPDIVGIGEFVLGVGFAQQQSREGHTAITVRVGHGTSVAAPIVAGIAALCIEAMRQVSEGKHASHIVNIALMKRLIMETAEELQSGTAPYQTLEESITRAKSSSPYRWRRRGKSYLHDQMVMNRGVAFTQTMMYFRNVLQYSRMSQGTGEACPLCALHYIEHIYKNVEDTICEAFAFPNMIDATSAHHVSFLSNETTKSACDIYWPYCEQPLFPSATPVVFNITLHYPRCASADLSRIHVTFTGSKGSAQKEHYGAAKEIPLEMTDGLLIIRAVASPVISSYTGWLAVFAVSPTHMSELPLLKQYGLVVVSGYVNVTYTCRSVSANDWCKGEIGQGSRVSVPFKIPIVARPARAHRVVFDVTHQWFYPPDFVPSDNARRETFNRHRRRRHDFRRHLNYDSFFEQLSDHPYTNMAPLFLYLRRVMGFYVEIPLISHFLLNDTPVASSWGELMRKYYRRVGTLVLMDSELPFTVEERSVIEESVRQHRLNLLIVSEWYSEHVARGLSFYDKPKDRFASPVFGFANNTNQTIERFFGLKGACHVPSINALLYSVSEGMLQLDESQVVDGDFILRGNDRVQERYLARLSSAGVLRRLQQRKKTSDSGTEVNPVMICGIANTWIGGLYYLEKMASRDNTYPKQDLLLRVPPNTFVPVFGFVGMGNQSHKHRSGRVSLVTDSNCLVGSADMLSSLHMIDRIMSEVSVGLSHQASLSKQTLVALDSAVRGLVQEEGKRPSLCLELIDEMFRFLYTGDGSRFRSGAQCEVSTLRGVPLERNVNATEFLNEESDRLLQQLLSAAPARVAVGVLVREVLEEVLITSSAHSHSIAEEEFLENQHPVLNSTQFTEKEHDEDSLSPTTLADFLLSFVFLVIFFLLAVILFLFFRMITHRGPSQRIKRE